MEGPSATRRDAQERETDDAAHLDVRGETERDTEPSRDVGLLDETGAADRRKLGAASELDTRGAREQQEARIDKLRARAARRLFFAGFLGLPWLWAICYVRFRDATAPPELVRHVRRSAAAALLAFVALAAWTTYVALSWRTWGEQGEALMLFVPESAQMT
jgi:hypothetical protein